MCVPVRVAAVGEGEGARLEVVVEEAETGAVVVEGAKLREVVETLVQTIEEVLEAFAAASADLLFASS